MATKKAAKTTRKRRNNPVEIESVNGILVPPPRKPRTIDELLDLLEKHGIRFDDEEDEEDEEVVEEVEE